jgi:hypothetical protein
MVANELKGKPLTAHELFSTLGLEDSWLQDYTMRAERFQHDPKGNLWQNVLLNKQTDVLVLPPNTMGPDLLGILECLPKTASYAKYGPHCIPIVAGCKLFREPNSTKYQKNYATTNIWDGFTREGKILTDSEEQRATLLKILSVNFGTNKRMLRISFTYNPVSNEGKQLCPDADESIHVKFDHHHKEFKKTLQRNKEQGLKLLNKFTGKE